jgi:hypothetical protein
MATEIDGGKLTTVRRPGRTLATVPASYGGALVPRMASTVAKMTGDPPPRRNSAWDVAEKWDDGGGSALFLRWGKTVEGRTSGSFIGVRVLVHAERYPKSILQLNRRLLQNLLRIRLDSVLDVNSQRPGDKALGTAPSVGVLDDHRNMSWCRIQMTERRGTRAKVAADGGQQAVSRGRIGMAPGYGVNPG